MGKKNFKYRKIEKTELAEMIPPMDDEEYRALRDDIQKHGLSIPIVKTKDGKIVDGYHRFRACCELGIRPKWVIVENTDDAEYRLNIFRRHLPVEVRALLAARYAERNQLPGDKMEHAAKLAGVSRSTVARAKTIMRNAHPDVIEALAKREISVSKAADIMRLPEGAQKQILNKDVYLADLQIQREGRKGVFGAPPRNWETQDEGYGIILIDARELGRFGMKHIVESGAHNHLLLVHCRIKHMGRALWQMADAGYILKSQFVCAYPPAPIADRYDKTLLMSEDHFYILVGEWGLVEPKEVRDDAKLSSIPRHPPLVAILSFMEEAFPDMKKRSFMKIDRPGWIESQTASGETREAVTHS
jgi:ParB-like chromosome segregation protein Spo0J